MNANPTPGPISGVQLLTWTRFADLRSYKYFSCKKLVEAGGSEYSGVLKTRKLLKNREAQNARESENAPSWNVSGTRIFTWQTLASGTHEDSGLWNRCFSDRT